MQAAADQVEVRTDVAAQYEPYLGDPCVRQFLDRWYGFTADSSGEIDVSFLEMHRVGTTSFILGCLTVTSRTASTSDMLALKCLIPRYVNIPPIANATAQYQSRITRIRRAGATNVPQVRDYRATRFIAMAYIAGPTLDERTRDLLRRLPQEQRADAFLSSDEALRFIRLITIKLTDALANLAKYDQRHLDLSPYNVIIDERDVVYLIDFGRNHLVDEILRGGPAYERIVMYIAPELMANPATDDYTCDLYSLGIVILDVLTGGGMSRDRINGRLMHLWRAAPGLAAVVEALIATDPNRRARAGAGSTVGERYEAIRDRLLEEIEIAAASTQRIKADGADWLVRGGVAAVTLADYLMIKPPEIGALFDAARELANNRGAEESDRARYFRKLGWWARTYVLVWSLVSLPALGLIFGDLTISAGTITHVGAPSHNIPGITIAVTTALIAIGYYMNIFAMFDLRPLRHSRFKICRIAPFTTRIVPLLAVAAQGVTVYDPRLWGYTAGIGGLLVSANNLVWRRVLKIGRASLGEDDRLASELAEFEESFRNWWWLMGMYSLGVLAAGLLIRAGLAHDEIIYAVVIAGGVNIAKLYVNNVTKDAPRVRSHLARALAGLGAGST